MVKSNVGANAFLLQKEMATPYFPFVLSAIEGKKSVTEEKEKEKGRAMERLNREETERERGSDRENGCSE